MTREEWRRLIETPKMLDYGVHLAVDRLLDCQKPPDEM